MKIPEYTYYIGKNKRLAITKGKKYPSSGILPVADENYNITAKMPLANVKAIYIDDNSITSVIATFFRGQVITSQVSIPTGQIFTVPGSVSSVALNIKVNDYTKDMPFSKAIYCLKECSPVYTKLSKKYVKENGQEYFTEKLDGNVSFFGDDYSYIDTLDSNYLFIILRNADRKLEGVGHFDKTDCTIDTLKQKISATLQTHDIYSLVKSRWETKCNIIDNVQNITPIISKLLPVIQLYILGSSTVTSIIGNNFYETSVEASQNSVSDAARYGFYLCDKLCELEIKNCPIAEANGLYTGNMRTGMLYLATNNSFFIRVSPDNNTQLELCQRVGQSIQVKYNSQYIVTKDDWNLYDFGTSRINFLEITTAAFTSEIPIYYYVTCRILANKTYSNIYPLTVVPPSDFATSGWNYRYYIKGVIGRVSNFIGLQISGLDTDKITEYGKNDFNRYFIYDSSRIDNAKPVIPIGKDNWANASLWVQPNNLYYTSIFENLQTEYTIKDCIDIGDAIKAVLIKLDLPITYEPTAIYSNFLHGSVWPGSIGDLQEDRFRVFITQKSNTLKSRYSQAAKRVEISLKEILDELALLFRCFWFIDNRNKLRIEHISYFMNGRSYLTNPITLTADLTKRIDRFNTKLYSYAQQTIDFDTENFISEYSFEWAESTVSEFGLEKFNLDDNYLADAQTQTITGSFIPDIASMLLNADSYSKDGFTLFCALSGTNGYYLPIKKFKYTKQNGVENLAYDIYLLNGLASWNNLIYFYLWDLSGTVIRNKNFIAIYSNDGSSTKVPTSVKGLKYFVTQKDIVFLVDNDLVPEKGIKTNIGTGLFKQISIDINTKVVTVIATYPPSVM